MNDCAAHQAFTLLWSVTDKIFEHVADIQNLMNTSSAPVASGSPDDPPSYESSTSEHLIGQLKERMDRLEDLNKQRKVIYDQYVNKGNQCDQVKKVHTRGKQQEMDKTAESKHHDAAAPRDAAIKTLRSFLRTRQEALLANHDLLVQIRQGLSVLPEGCFYTSLGGQTTWRPDTEQKFYAELKLFELFSFQTTKDRSSLLTNAKTLKEKILSVPHDAGEETTKLIGRVENSYRHAEEIIVPTILDLLLPIFANFPKCVIQNKLTDVLYSIFEGIETFNNRYMKMVAANQDALQDLADLLVP